MESLFTLLAGSLALRLTTKKFKRYRIGTSACTSLLLAHHNRFHIRYTRDGDRMLFNNADGIGISYGIIIVEMKHQQPVEKAKVILKEYARKMRKPLGIAHSVEAESLTTKNFAATTGYWQDAQGVDWKFKGYTNGILVAVLYVKNVTATATAEHESFLDGFRFGPATVIN